jgi:hypothetical protein
MDRSGLHCRRVHTDRDYTAHQRLGKLVLEKFLHFYDITHAILHFPIIVMREYHLGENAMNV